MTVILSACGSKEKFKPDTFSIKDMCIVKVENGDSVCYGDSREKAEQVLGVGRKAEEKYLKTYEYDFGVYIYYRDNRIAGIILEPESEGVYQTARGARIGDRQSTIKEMYGEMYVLESMGMLDYVYDSKQRKFLGRVSLESTDSEKFLDIYQLSVLYDTVDEENVKRIILCDRRFAKYLD